MCKPLDFEDRDHKALLNHIMEGDIVLFLGSGFSIGATRKEKDPDNGELLPLPDVNDLKRLLANNVLCDSEMESDTLKEICEECQEENTSKYVECMRNCFTVCDVCDFHKQYATIDWKKIFTINVDNVVETIYEDPNRLCCVYSPDPRYGKPHSIPLYKLHGCAIKDPEHITFSTTDYVTNAAYRNDCRFEELAASLKVENILFVGTSLTEEWDIDIKTKMQGVGIVRNKVYFVLKEYNEKLLKRLHRKFHNAVFIQETACSFIKKIIQYKSSPHNLQSKSYSRWNLREIHKKNYNLDEYLSPDLYLGAEPTWEDIFTEHDVIWEKTSELIKEIKRNGLQKNLLIVGKAISGKTTMLYRLGVSLSDQYRIYEYLGDNFIEDMKGVLLHIREDENAIILLDDANWLLGRIAEIGRLFDTPQIKFIATVREKEYERKQHLFDKAVFKSVKIVENINRLSTEDIGLYLDKLYEKSFLGSYAYKYEKDRDTLIEEIKKDFEKKKRDSLLNLALKFRYGNQLEARLKEIGESVIKSSNYNIKRFVMLLYFIDVIGDMGMKLSLFLDLYPMNQEQLQLFLTEIKDSLISNASPSGWQRMEYEKIILHSRLDTIIKKAIHTIDFEERENLLEDIFQRLNSVHHYRSRQSNTYYNFVLYTLLRSQNIKKVFTGANQQIHWEYIRRLYKSLHEGYGDYHLYWLHRGISEVRMKQYEAAHIHLEQARSVRNGYSYEIEHAVATLYFEEAIHSSVASQEVREQKLKKALEIIKLQIDREENDAFCIHSFIVKTIQCYKAFRKEIPHYLLQDMLNYYYKAKKRFQLSQSTMLRNMLNYIYQYLSDNELLYKGIFSIDQEELAYLQQRNNVVDVDILDII